MTLAATPASRLTAGFGVALAAFSAATFGFGTTFAFLAYEGGSNALSVVLVRTAIFVIVVGLILVSPRRLAWLSRRALIGTLWMALTLAMVSMGYQGSVAFIPVSLAALVFYTYPLMVGVFAVAAGRDRMTAGKAAALMAGFFGLALALGPEFGALDWRGIALALLAAVGMGLTMTFGGAAMQDQDALLMSVYTNVWMLIVLAVVEAAAAGFALPTTTLGAASMIGVAATYVIAYVCWYLALSIVRPVRLAALFNIEPVVTLLVAWLALGERLAALQFLGAALVLASVLSLSLTRPGDEGGHSQA
jgi:drug/metabolite transporter (DMT)-like permease